MYFKSFLAVKEPETNNNLSLAQTHNQQFKLFCKHMMNKNVLIKFQS